MLGNLPVKRDPECRFGEAVVCASFELEVVGRVAFKLAVS